MTTRIGQLPIVAGLAVLIGSSAVGQSQSKPPTPVVIPASGSQDVTPPANSAQQGKPNVPGLRGIEPEDYRIGPEDVLDISVWKDTELTRSVPVRPDGKITVPLLNDIQAANMTPMQLRDTLAKGYAQYLKNLEEEHPVSVAVKEIHSIKISVVGKVKTPGRYELKDQATVLEALALAGGLTEFADSERLVVFRRVGKGWSKLPFNYKTVVSKWDEQQNFTLQPGDIIVVP